MDFRQHLEKSLSSEFVDSLLASLSSTPTHCLFLNPDKMRDEEFLSLCPSAKPHPLVPHAYFYQKKDFEAGKSLWYDLGCFSIQDASAMLPPFFLSPKPGERVLDFCAAPGGKTILLSKLMQGKGTIVANDLSYPRAKALSQNIERMGIGNVLVLSQDLEQKRPSWDGFFDRILLDAPCSGSAMFRKDEEARAFWSEEKVHQCALVQARLLDLAYSFLRPGGTLCYSTCSFSSEENEENIASFLARHHDLKALKAPLDSPLFVHDSLVQEGIHLYPHLFPGEGQYLCLLQKEGEAPRGEFKEKSKVESLPLLTSFHMEKWDAKEIGGVYNVLEEPFPLKGLTCLRYGVRVEEKKPHAIPEFALARYLSSSFSLSLTPLEAQKYLAGESFSLQGQDGFHVVSCQGKTLGWVKLVHGTAKNHYPKGLRHLYPLNAF